MADLTAKRLTVITLAGGAGAAVRLQVFGGSPQQAQWLAADLELTGAQNTALVTALQAAAGTTTNFDVPAQPSPLPGVYNASV